MHEGRRFFFLYVQFCFPPSTAFSAPLALSDRPVVLAPRGSETTTPSDCSMPDLAVSCSCVSHSLRATAALCAGCAPELVARVPRRRHRSLVDDGHWSGSKAHCATTSGGAPTGASSIRVGADAIRVLRRKVVDLPESAGTQVFRPVPLRKAASTEALASLLV